MFLFCTWFDYCLYSSSAQLIKRNQRNVFTCRGRPEPMLTWALSLISSPILPVTQRHCRLYPLHHGWSRTCTTSSSFIFFPVSCSSPADHLNVNGKGQPVRTGDGGCFLSLLLLALNLTSAAVIIGFIDTAASAGQTADHIINVVIFQVVC